nr:AIR carboxylase family protein [Clostridiales bacterium]
GIPVATVAMNGAANAAHLAVEILALSDDTLASAVEAARQAGADKVRAKDRALREKL